MANLKSIRLSRLLTQKEMADECDISLSSLQAIERGEYVGIVVRRKVLDALGLPREVHRDVFGPVEGENDAA